MVLEPQDLGNLHLELGGGGQRSFSMAEGRGNCHCTYTHRPTDIVQDDRPRRVDCVGLVFGTTVRPEDDIAFSVFNTRLAIGYADWIPFEVRDGQATRRILADAPRRLIRDARIQQKGPFAFHNCLPDVLCRLLEDAGIRFVPPGPCDECPVLLDECSPCRASPSGGWVEPAR
jgi:hypothetical protein